MLENDGYNLEKANFYIRVASIVGLVTALYSYYVKIKFNRDPKNYTALCDFNEHMSCSRVVSSKYGRGFGIVGKILGEQSALNISNSILGSIFYLVQFALSKLF
jgi:vitamin-K-epoxide reductase (warfarin-sensitive)